MRALDIIIKKRSGQQLTKEELVHLINGYVAGEIPEYQISAWLMAVFFQGMTPEETKVLTEIMIASGDVFDLTGLSGPFVDKHSTGGVGDKVSLILAPLAASLGVQIPMMSGRSLGHTGGTLDKLESIPGYSTAMDQPRFREIIGSCGFAMTGQSREIVPADRLLYALRDATGTVESIPLITGSILSKKFAEGADALVFDVKTGPGAFMKTQEQARNLAQSLVATGRQLGKTVVAVLTRMDAPLGTMVGNFLEVEESIACLQGEGWEAQRTPQGQLVYTGPSADLMEVTIRLTAWMLVAGGIAGDVTDAEDRCLSALADGRAYQHFLDNVRLQGGDIQEMERRIGTWRAPIELRVSAPRAGVVASLDAFKVGMAGVYLGAGRNKTTDPVQPHVGVEVLVKPGTEVTRGQDIYRLWAQTQEQGDEARTLLEKSIEIGDASTGVAGPSGMIVEELYDL